MNKTTIILCGLLAVTQTQARAQRVAAGAAGNAGGVAAGAAANQGQAGVNGTAVGGTVNGTAGSGVNGGAGATDANGNAIGANGTVNNGSAGVNGSATGTVGDGSVPQPQYPPGLQNERLRREMAGQTNGFANGTNQFVRGTNGAAFTTNNFAYGTNRLRYFTNQDGQITNGVITSNNRFAGRSTNTVSPTAQPGARNRVYGTNNVTGGTNNANRSSVFQDQASTPADQSLLIQIRQTLLPQIQSPNGPWSVPVHFSVADSTVTVSGSVQTAAQRAQIVSIVKSVPGVTSVNDQMVVGRQPGVNTGGAVGTGVGSTTTSVGTGADGSTLFPGTNGVAPVTPIPPTPSAAPQQ